jgi:gliding motility-associated-like protein
MHRVLLLYLGCLLSLNAAAHDFQAPELDYVENKGQWDSRVKYKVDLHGGWAFLQEKSITYLFYDPSVFKNGKAKRASIKDAAREQRDPSTPVIFKGHAYEMSWMNANDIVPTSSDVLPHYYNFFTDSDPSKWKASVKLWKKVHYNDLYNKIDLEVYSMGTSMKSDYIVRQGGNPKQIRMKYEGVDKIQVLPDGRLHIETSITDVFEYEPYAYQKINGQEIEVLCRYVLNGNELSFDFPNGYNKSHDLVIDPTLIFSTYSGSPSDNWGASSTNDRDGNMFLGGIVLGSSFPTTLGAFQTTFGGGSGSNGTDVVITKFNATGTARIFSTFLGGSSNELLTSLFCTEQNELIALVTTSSTNFPTTQNAFRRQFAGGTSTSALGGSITFPNGTDIAIVKFNAAGSGLSGSTYYGGTGNDGLNNAAGLLFNYGDESRSDIDVDGQGNIYIASVTNSPNLQGTQGSAQSALAGVTDGMVLKLNANLSNLSWASYFGGSAADATFSIKLDDQNNVLICGGTRSNNLPGTANGLNPSFRGGTVDGYVAKLNNAGTAIINATYLGTNNYDQAFLMDLDNAGNPVVFGQTLGAYPVTGGTYSNPSSRQFLHKLNNALTQTIFSTVFGRANYNLVNIVPTALLVDVCGNIYAVGWGGGINFDFALDGGTTDQMPITPDAFKSTTDGADFYLISLDNSASQLLYGSYFGETGSIFGGGGEDHVDGGTSRFDKNGIVYQAVCASCGGTNSFPTTSGVIGPRNNSTNCNMAGFKFRFDLLALQVITAGATPPQGCGPLTTSFNYTASRPGVEFFWDFGDGNSSTQERPTHTYQQPGTYSVKFVIKNPTDCNPQDSTTFTVRVFGSDSTTVNRTICDGQSVSVGNQTFNEPGTYVVNLQTSLGCDSVVTLTLAFSDSIVSNISETLCAGSSFTLGQQVLNESGVYTASFTTSAGCDSTVTLNLTILDSIVVDVDRAICEGQSVTVGGQTFNETGFYTVLLESSLGCDSTVNLSLLVSDQAILDLEETICAGGSFSIAGQTFTESGEYVINIEGEACDTVINLSLNVVPNPIVTASADPTAVESGDLTTLNATAQGQFTYSWTPASLVSSPGQATTSAQVFESTWFVVVATDANGCQGLDSVLVIVFDEDCQDENVFLPSAFTPNGDGKNDVLFVRSSVPLESMRLIIYNRWGEQVFESDNQNAGWDGNYKDKPAQAGVYGFYLEAVCGETIIERKGNVTIIR